MQWRRPIGRGLLIISESSSKNVNKKSRPRAGSRAGAIACPLTPPLGIWAPVAKIHLHLARSCCVLVYLNYTYYINILEDAYGC